MDEGWPRRGAEPEYRRRDDERPFMRRPDRIALWAVGIAVVAMIAAAASAHGATGTAAKHFTHTDDIHAVPISK
jgi:ferric-dicitrate binding protein FerR (iron transport regulator)